MWLSLLVTKLGVLLTFSGHVPEVLNSLQYTGQPQITKTVPSKMPTMPPLITLENGKAGRFAPFRALIIKPGCTPIKIRGALAGVA